ncbi:DUF4431 domain-containing protein [Geomonas oryzisoli]|uniref:DUF4431 domain-containing protein n=1 Tax=Geomonas oryzisoli TaxID=2847992 RepID=A0ABX8J9L2_9BACT|nr:DUF4431 domain-containing protein [Geomonas oryzisoli]QWV95125.1 DUF4431 domain-containing protein [Geomonas oryzisoli]
MSVLILLTGTVFAKDTYHYEPAIAELTGKLIEKVYYGPPGYGENPKTDSKEHATVLRLTSPIKVIADKKDEINETKNNIKELQVINIKRLPLSIYLKKNVRISGRLSSAITGHHHTDVLVEIDSIALQ